MRPIILACALALATLPGPRPGAAEGRVWYGTGHRLVARIAALRLTPHTRQSVRELLGGEDLADASLWADQIRGQRRETGPLHFVNIPLEAVRYSPEYCTGGSCIITAIESDRRILADAAGSLPERAEALRFLIHFIGDLHQPLHVSDNGDRGGNERQVVFLGSTSNLHQVWDGELIDATGLDESQYFDHLRQVMDSLDLAALERGTVVDWAMEGHRVAVEHAYRLPPGEKLGNEYLEANLPLVDRALIAAGVRLAKVLNDALVAYQPAPSDQPALPPHSYSDLEAAAHVGEEATVAGIVVTVHRSKRGTIYLNFGADYPHQTMSAVLLDPPREAWVQGLERLAGKRVAVKGLIRRYKGRVEISVERAEQIEVVR